MTDEERTLLRDTAKKTDAIHRALFDRGFADEPALIDRMVAVATIIERSTWATKWTIRGILTIGGIAAALASIWANAKGLGK